jgi:hypothetical protein
MLHPNDLEIQASDWSSVHRTATATVQQEKTVNPVARSPKSESPKSESPKSKSPKSESPKSESLKPESPLNDLIPENISANKKAVIRCLINRCSEG